MANKATIHDALEADALEIALMKWRIGVCADTDTSPEVLAQIKQRGGIKPSDARRAADLFDIARMESWWQIYVALKCAAITDGESALNVYDDALALGWGTSRLKEAIAETKPQRAKRKADADEDEDYSALVLSAIKDFTADYYKICHLWSDADCSALANRINTAIREAGAAMQSEAGDGQTAIQ